MEKEYKLVILPCVTLRKMFFPYKDRIKYFALIRKNKGQRKPVFWHIAHAQTLFIIFA